MVKRGISAFTSIEPGDFSNTTRNISSGSEVFTSGVIRLRGYGFLIWLCNVFNKAVNLIFLSDKKNAPIQFIIKRYKRIERCVVVQKRLVAWHFLGLFFLHVQFNSRIAQ